MHTYKHTCIWRAQQSGTDQLPNSAGELEDVEMRQTEIRTGYEMLDPTTLAKGFFDTRAVCFFPDNIRFPHGSEKNECAGPTCIKDGCVTGDITKNDAKKHCCHSGHETNRCKGTHWRCDPPTALRGRAFEFPQQQV